MSMLSHQLAELALAMCAPPSSAFGARPHQRRCKNGKTGMAAVAVQAAEKGQLAN